MNKKELRNMKLLEATDELIKLAKEDVPVRDKGYYSDQLIYQRGLYLRAEVENNILKVAFYLAEYLSIRFTSGFWQVCEFFLIIVLNLLLCAYIWCFYLTTVANNCVIRIKPKLQIYIVTLLCYLENL